MIKYFCLSCFIDLLKEKYPKIRKCILCFDPKITVEKIKFNQLLLYPFVIVIYIDGKKLAIVYLKLI
ncbi:MAG: hypothetical protein Ta2E_00460 [Mycoplasmoidaceae bacterium]|nr:MAG: hypothetical protein Ta2E_00460 [Mycoplasmoidaceae bacterium]